VAIIKLGGIKQLSDAMDIEWHHAVHFSCGLWLTLHTRAWAIMAVRRELKPLQKKPVA